MTISILFLSDTHLGFDCPSRPRVDRRRRCEEFFANFERALAAACNLSVDLVIHGGDVFFRSRVRREIVEETIKRLRTVTKAGIPIYIVPGNHERSALPCPLLWQEENIFVFDEARTYLFEKSGIKLALAGFPYSRETMATNFRPLVEGTKYGQHKTQARLLCFHHIVESSIVGPKNYQFRHGKDVIPLSVFPNDFAALLTGHIHTFQILTKDIDGSTLPTPVYYPGSTCRTSFAEKLETKGFLILTLEGTECGKGQILDWEFHSLPSRPMEDLTLALGLKRAEFTEKVQNILSQLHEDSIVRLTIDDLQENAPQWLTSAYLRELAPKTMNVDLRWPRKSAS